MSTSNTNSNSEYFIKQRDLLLQEVSNNLNEVYNNIENLNRSLNESIQIGKEFDDVGRLWSSFYDGINELKERSNGFESRRQEQQQESKEENINSED
ncbi:DAD1 [Candida pseudojiufengensis]|uniref:DAD1 n=1 Tax=Candida pseudojiufengensis TaxID=497109 RepID=UPI0022245FB5|nr:DAD1 [Candida pseudojiufengensis]KAI5962267.1 DAD1 [Candida pseudojiufengensis]